MLTQDPGVQEIPWIGKITKHASVEFAPLLIKANTLNNVTDLVLRPENGPFFTFQRSDKLSAGRTEALVPVRELVTGRDFKRLGSDYSDYSQILLYELQCIYAKDIAFES